MKKTVIVVLIAGFLVCLVLSVSSTVVERRREDMIRGVTAEANLKMAHVCYLVSEFIKERRNVVSLVSSWMNPNWILLPKVYKKVVGEKISCILEQYPGFDSVHFLDTKGIVVWGFPKEKSLEGVDFSRDVLDNSLFQTLFVEARRRRTTVVAPMRVTRFDSAEGRLVTTEVLLMAAPVFRSDTYLGLLFTILRPEAIGGHIFPLIPPKSMKGTIWVLMDGQGKILYSNTVIPDRLREKTSFLAKTAPAERKEIRSTEFFIKRKGSKEHVLVSYSPLSIGQRNLWYVVRLRPLSGIDSDMHRWLFQTRAIAFAAIIVMVLIAVFLVVSFNRSERMLDALNHKYRDLLDNLQVGAFSFDATGKIDYVNKKACEILGYPPSEIIGRDRLFFAWEKEREKLERMSRQRIEGKRKSEAYRAHMVHRSGKVIDVEIHTSPVLNDQGKVQSIRVMFSDITRQLEMEREIENYTRHLEELVDRRTQALRESESLYRSIFETSLAIIYIHQDDKFKIMNKTGMEFFGFKTRDEMLRANVWDTIPEAERQRRRDNAMRRMLGDDIPSCYESLVIDKNGDVRVFACNFQRIMYWDGPAILAILFDITEKKHLEAEIVHAEKLKSMGQLATGVAHDFNNILSAILGRIQLLELHPDDPDAVRSSVELVKKAVDQGIDAVKRIQEFTRVRRDRIASDLMPLHRIIDDAIEITRFSWKDQAQRKGITIRIERDYRDRNLFLSSELREVFMNIVLNAVDAMPEGGTLKIRTESVVLKNGTEGVRVIFEDTGTGMAPEVLEHAFRPFYTTKGDGGSGLGLSIVCGVIDRLRGEIRIDSAPGEGTAVIIEIPWQSWREESKRIRRTVSHKLGTERRKGSILVVDDEPQLPEIIKELLSSLGYDVVVSTKGEEALALFRKTPERYALIFTDLGMPGINGWKFAERIREISEDVPIILMTGWGLELEISEEEILKLRITELVNKPVTLDIVTDIVNRYIIPS